MYVIRTRGAQTTLLEMSQKELVEALKTDMKNVANPQLRSRHRRVSASEAHRYVKDGGHHETGLWVDDGKVRYAKADPDG